MMTKIYPRTGDKQTVYLNAVVKDPVNIHDIEHIRGHGKVFPIHLDIYNGRSRVGSRAAQIHLRRCRHFHIRTFRFCERLYTFGIEIIGRGITGGQSERRKGTEER